MAIDAKIDFIRQMEERLSSAITVADMANVMSAMQDVLQGYEMRSIAVWEGNDDDLLDCYLSALSVECKSPLTIKRYSYVIKRLMKFLNVPTRSITIYHLRNYLQHEKARGICDNTLDGLRQVFSAYFNWLQRESLIEKNPTANLGTIKVAKKEKKTYSEVDIEKLVRGCKSLRDRAIIHFLASTGCRISEMTELNRDSIKLDSLEFIVHGKGNKERVAYMSEVAGMLLQECLSNRKDDNEALFVGQRNERFQPGGVRAMLKTLAKKVSVNHVHPHKFRRTLATDLARHGMPIQEIAAILGHEKIDTTMKYVVLNKEDVKMSYRRYA